jgi:hypothetical protein
MASSTSTRAGRAATGAVSGAAGNAGSQVLRAAGWQLLATVGNQVLKVATDRAVGKVDDVAGRLDAVASGERRKPSRPPTNRKPTERPIKQDDRPASPVRVKVGAAFNLVVQQAIRLLQLVQRLAQQLLAAVSQLFRRGGGDAAADADVTENQGVDRMVPRKKAEKAEKVDKAERPDGRRTAERPRPAAGQPARAPQARRRQGPRPAAREAAGAPRRTAGDRPVRPARND